MKVEKYGGAAFTPVRDPPRILRRQTREGTASHASQAQGLEGASAWGSVRGQKASGDVVDRQLRGGRSQWQEPGPALDQPAAPWGVGGVREGMQFNCHMDLGRVV